MESLYKYLNHIHPVYSKIYPVVYNNKKCLFATNGYELVLLEVDDLKFDEYTKAKTDPDVLSIIPTFDKHTEVEISELVSKYTSIPTISQQVTLKCECCGGLGNFEHYGYEYNCKPCEGYGDYKTNEFENVKDPSVKIKFGSLYINNGYIKNMFNFKNFKDSKLYIKYIDDTKIIFDIDSIIFMLVGNTMEYLNNNNIEYSSVEIIF